MCGRVWVWLANSILAKTRDLTPNAVWTVNLVKGEAVHYHLRWILPTVFLCTRSSAKL